MVNDSMKNFNPWVSIWIRPRATIQQIVDTNPYHLVFVLAIPGGFAEILDRSAMEHLGDKFEWPDIFGIAAVAAPIFGIVSLFLTGALIQWTGELIGGFATARTIRCAIAWGWVPNIWGLTLWVPGVILFGQELFTTNKPIILSNPALSVFLIGFAVIKLIVEIWALIIFVKCLGQVQGFSALAAFVNILLAGLALAIIIVLGLFFLLIVSGVCGVL